MENNIKALFYLGIEKDMALYESEVEKLDHSLAIKNIPVQNDIKQEMNQSDYDLIVLEENTAGEDIDSIINKVLERDTEISILVVAENLTEKLVKTVYKSGVHEIVSKSNPLEVGLSMVRCFKRSNFMRQYDFTRRELLRSQKTQNEHDHFLNQVIESTSNPIFYKGTKGRYLGCNKAFADFLGLSKEEIIGKKVFDIAPKEFAQKYHKMDQEFFDNPITQKYEYQVVSANGEVKDVLFYKTAIFDDEGNISGLLGHMFDITDVKKLKKDIQEEKDIADFILDTSDVIYITLNEKGEVGSANRKACNVLEISKDKLLGKNWFDHFIPKDEIPKVKKIFKNTLQGSMEEAYEVTGNILTANGETKTILWKNRVIKNHEGMTIGTLSSGKELTEDGMLEQKLELSEKKYQLLVENMQEGLSIVDLDENVVFSNPSFDRIFGCKPGEMIGKNLKDFVLEEDLEKVFKGTSHRKSDISSQYKVGITRKDGKERIITISSAPWKDQNNKVIGAIGMMMDRTAEEYSTLRLEKRSLIEQSIINISSQFITTENFETKLENTLNELHKIIEAERYSILTVKKNKLHLISQRNDNGLEKESLELDQIDYHDFGFALNMLETMDFIFIDDVTELPAEAQREKEIFGKSKIFNFLGIPFYTGAELSGLLTISNIYEVDEWTIEDLSLLRTISDIIGHALHRQRAEEKVDKLNLELVNKNNELEQVVYVTSHDIRSPVVNILGFSDEMAKAMKKLNDKIFTDKNTINNTEDIEYLLNKDVPQIMDFIKVSGQKIDNLLLALLKLSRLGRAAITKQNVNMNEMVKTVLSTFEYKINDENIQVHLGEIPGCYTDEVQINQVFSNLVDNAIKYRSHDKQPEIWISGTEENDRVTYCIEDNGIGIPESEIDKIFDVFYRINPENQSGEGMGLALIKKTVERLDGSISVGSSEGKGTKFYINLEKQKA